MNHFLRLGLGAQSSGGILAVKHSTWEEASMTGEFQVEQLEYGIHIGGTRFTYVHLEFRFFYNFRYVTTTYMYLKVPVELPTILTQYPLEKIGFIHCGVPKV